MNQGIELVWLSKKDFDTELKAIKDQEIDNKIKFLRGIHSWRNLNRTKMLRFISLCEEKKYNHGNTVYAEKQPNSFVYVVQSGEFELYKSLPMKKRSLTLQRSDQDISVQNVLADKLNEVKDFPLTLKVNIFQKGSLVGEDDIIGRKEYTCTLKCIS